MFRREYMDSKKALMAVVTVLGVIASAYLFLQGKIAFEEYSHWKSREAVLEKEIEQLRKEAKHHREFLDRLRRDPDYQDAVARKELGYGKPKERLYRFPKTNVSSELNPEIGDKP